MCLRVILLFGHDADLSRTGRRRGEPFNLLYGAVFATPESVTCVGGKSDVEKDLMRAQRSQHVRYDVAFPECGAIHWTELDGWSSSA